MKNTRPSPLLLIILDGFGERPPSATNAISLAHTPCWDYLLKNYPHTSLAASGLAVGLPAGQMGNSEVGHLNMGAGRVVYQDLTRIDHAIETHTFFQNKLFNDAFNQAKLTKKKVHILGLLSTGGVHSHERHIHALLQLAANRSFNDIYVHAFLDGRDTPPQSAKNSLLTLETLLARLQCGKIASIMGRYYAMDRDKRWERVAKAYELLAEGKASYHANSAEAGLEMAYARGETDEFVAPTQIIPAFINDGDIVIFMNFRADRARQLTQALTDPNFVGFPRAVVPNIGEFICLSEYDVRFHLPVAFPPENLTNIFGEYISQQGLKQLRIAETEKYAHVTFFFNGGIEKPYANEERLLIPSAKVATYDLQPEMSAIPLTSQLIEEIKKNQYDVIICNYANPDMVGHTGNLPATIKAVETIDKCLAQLVAVLHEAGGELIITADHGNAEQMFDPQTNQPHTAHTSDPVPFVYVGRPSQVINKNGKLSDIAPTLLYLLGLPKPKEMSGESLVRLV